MDASAYLFGRATCKYPCDDDPITDRLFVGQRLDKSEITYIYKPALFDEIPRAKLKGFCTQLIAESKADMKKLETWKNHFKSVGVPFAITKTPMDRYTVVQIWKERYIQFGMGDVEAT